MKIPSENNQTPKAEGAIKLEKMSKFKTAQIVIAGGCMHTGVVLGRRGTVTPMQAVVRSAAKPSALRLLTFLFLRTILVLLETHIRYGQKQGCDQNLKGIMPED